MLSHIICSHADTCCFAISLILFLQGYPAKTKQIQALVDLQLPKNRATSLFLAILMLGVHIPHTLTMEARVPALVVVGPLHLHNLARLTQPDQSAYVVLPQNSMSSAHPH